MFRITINQKHLKKKNPEQNTKWKTVGFNGFIKNAISFLDDIITVIFLSQFLGTITFFKLIN